MSTRMRLPAIVAALAASTALALVAPALARADSAANDAFADAASVDALPFNADADLAGNGTEPGEPQFCNFQMQTVWYAFTPAASTAVAVDVFGSDVGVVYSVYRAVGDGLAGLSSMACGGWFGGEARFNARAGTTYYVQAGTTWGGPGTLRLHIRAVEPPPNDDFADRMPVHGFPFGQTVDSSAATIEPGESVMPSGTFARLEASSWYSYTPSESGPLTARLDASPAIVPMLVVYTGDALPGLTQVAERFGAGPPLTFRAEAGITYHFQAARTDWFGGDALLSFYLEPTPPPVVDMFFWPNDPSTFDTVQFSSFAFDPGGVGIATVAWNLGDGSTADGCCPSHRYRQDGDYLVQVVATTLDGRATTVARTIAVRTHDVSIRSLSVPDRARAGTTKLITVGVANTRYAERVTVTLLRSVAGPAEFEPFGSLTLSVPVRARRVTTFAFSYTFTEADKELGKVTFKAVATLVEARDAITADNTVVAPATRVR